MDIAPYPLELDVINLPSAYVIASQFPTALVPTCLTVVHVLPSVVVVIFLDLPTATNLPLPNAIAYQDSVPTVFLVQFSPSVEYAV